MSERNVGDSSKAARSEVVEKTGDGSESAGLRVREALEDIVENARDYDGDTLDELPECMVKKWHIDDAKAALAPAISRPPTQGSLDTPQSGQHQGYRTIQDVLRLHVTSSESMYETYKRVGTPLEREHQLGITDGLLRAIEVADNWAARNGALAEGQQSGKLVEKTSRDTEGESARQPRSGRHES